MTNEEILNIYLENGLIDKCLDHQFAKMDKQFKGDYRNDLVIDLLEYDNAKLNSAHEGKHMNALLTRIIQNNIFSKTSWYYRRYVRFDRQTDEITEREKNIPDNE